MTKLSTTAIVALVMVTNAMLLEDKVNALSITVKSLMKTIQEQNFQIAYFMNKLEVKGNMCQVDIDSKSYQQATFK